MHVWPSGGHSRRKESWRVTRDILKGHIIFICILLVKIKLDGSNTTRGREMKKMQCLRMLRKKKCIEHVALFQHT